VTFADTDRRLKLMSRLLGGSGALVVLVAACSLLQPLPLAHNCAGWSQLKAEDQERTVAALIQPSLMDRVRERQHLQPDTPDEQVYLAVVSSITKTCDLQRQPQLPLAQVVRDLYESS
jgi:hypothetical protein